MSDVVSDKPYQFVPPYHGRWWAKFFQACLPRYLDRAWGITQVECRGLERLRRSLDARHGVLLAPNHPRGADPFVIGWLSRAVGQPFFCMASWHLFMDGGLQAWALRRMGAFSIFREGMDRTAVNTAIEILVSAERPLVIFPEGTVSRANDRLNPLMEGTALIARSAAKRRAKTSPPGEVVIHPVALRYHYQGDVRRAIEPVLEEIERRLTWRSCPEAAPLDRIRKIADALLALKELEYMGQPQQASLEERQSRLIEHILQPLESEWVKGEAAGHVVARVKRLRGAILPGLIQGDLAEGEIARRWRQLGDCTLAQQLAWYPPDYLNANSPSDRSLETVERFEEDLSGKVRTHRPFGVVIDVGEAIAVTPERDRHAATDPLLESIEHGLKVMLERPGGEPTAQEQNLVTA